LLFQTNSHGNEEAVQETNSVIAITATHESKISFSRILAQSQQLLLCTGEAVATLKL
jgi:hypothetical protein